MPLRWILHPSIAANIAIGFAQDLLESMLETAYEKAGGCKVDIVSHSMGGLVIKAFLALRPQVYERLVRKWITVATPFQASCRLLISPHRPAPSPALRWRLRPQPACSDLDRRCRAPRATAWTPSRPASSSSADGRSTSSCTATHSGFWQPRAPPCSSSFPLPAWTWRISAGGAGTGGAAGPASWATMARQRRGSRAAEGSGGGGL